MYQPTECIFDYLAACGDSEVSAIVAEVRIQCSAQNSLNATVSGVMTLLTAGIIEHVIDADDESGYFTLTAYGFELVDQWNSRDRRALREKQESFLSPAQRG